MALFEIEVEFVFTTTIQVEAVDAASASSLVMNATSDQVAHLNGKSYASVDEATRNINSITEII